MRWQAADQGLRLAQQRQAAQLAQRPKCVCAGAKTAGFIGSNQEGHTVIVMAAEADKTVGELGHAGCDHITVDSTDGVTATVERVAGPDIAGAKTMGVQAHITANGKAIEETTYTAVLGDKTVAVVQADVDPQVAKDLLVKAVAAIKS